LETVATLTNTIYNSQNASCWEGLENWLKIPAFGVKNPKTSKLQILGFHL